MQNHWERLTDWVIRKIETDYKEDIALLVAVKGHATDGDGHGECFDYFIPATKRGCELAQTFIIDGVGHDLYDRSWERTEQTAKLKDFTLCLANAELLYVRSQADADRFRALQEQLKRNLRNPLYVYPLALEKLDDAMDIYRTMMFEERPYMVRMAAGYIQLYLTQAVAFLNHTFADEPIFTEEQARKASASDRMYHCPELSDVPEAFYTYGNSILKTDHSEELRHLAYLQIRSTRRFILERQPKLQTEEPSGSMEAMADWYQELSLSWKRIRYFCDQGMTEEAYADACMLQSELAIIAKEFHFEELALLDAFDSENLEKLKARSILTEEKVRRHITSHGVKIREYESLDEFLAENE